MKTLQGKVAIVTGVTSGIGKAAAELFAAEGAKVVLAARRAEMGEELAHAIVARGGEAEFVHADVAEMADNEKLVKVAENRFGALHIAFNNAGTAHIPAFLADFDKTEFERVMRVNVASVFFGMRAQIPSMLRAGGGSIVNTSSVAGLAATAGMGPYSASKHAVVGLTKAAALEYAQQNIRVNALCPGGTHSEMFDSWTADPVVAAQVAATHPIGRFAQAAEPARAALFLCGDAASFITGAALPVDGGLLAQ
jgi:NAD(P)-dependent dehydrogenase (short-subunit alcohol dehydrogenase family)